MSNAIYRDEDPALETAELGALYRFQAPHTGNPWGLYKISDDCGVDSVEALEVPGGWDDAYEYAMADTRIWRRITSLAFEADLAHAILEIAFVPVYDMVGRPVGSKSLLYRFTPSCRKENVMTKSLHSERFRMNRALIRCEHCGQWFENWAVHDRHLNVESNRGILSLNEDRPCKVAPREAFPVTVWIDTTERH